MRERIDVGALEAEVTAASHGAVVTFVGVVRDRSDSGQLVRYLEYEAYDEMALRQMDAIARQIEEQWPGCSVAIIGWAARDRRSKRGHRRCDCSPRRGVRSLSPGHRLPQRDRSYLEKEVFQDGEAWVGREPDPDRLALSTPGVAPWFREQTAGWMQPGTLGAANRLQTPFQPRSRRAMPPFVQPAAPS